MSARLCRRVIRAISDYVEQGVEPGDRSLLWAARVFALALGAIRSWASRHVNNPGGVSYLDIADAYMRGDFANAVNGYWSPLYSLLLGPALAVLRPGIEYEAATAHFVNFLIFCCALATFDALLRAVIDRASSTQGAVPRWAWIAFGYAAFTWSSLILIGVEDLSADLLMAACVYGAAAVIVRMQAAPATTIAAATLGLMLGLGYLSKAAMFPLSFVFLATALMSRAEWRRNIPAVSIAAIVFALVAAPFVIALSQQKGRLTTGDVGKLVYAWFVNDVAKYAHWQGEPPGRGVPLHPDRKIHDQPQVFEYSTPVIGTHPAWYDPSYWYEGLETHFEPRKQARALRAAAEAYWELLKDAAAPLLAIGVLLSLGPVGDRRRQLSRQWFLFIPAIVPFAMFAVLHTETRFLGAFVVMALLALLLAVQLPPAAHARRVMAVTMIGGTIVLGLRTVVPAAEDLLARGWRLQNPDYDIAVGIRAVGLSPGDRVGAIGYPYDWYWARLAGVRIVADMPSPEVTLFWSATPERRASVYGAFRQAGVRALVSDSVPSTDAARGWSPIGSTGFFVYFLDGGAPR